MGSAVLPGAAARSQAETAPCLRAIARRRDELAIGGRRLDPGNPSPPRFENLTRSTSGACRPHDGVLREPLAGYFGLPPFYLI